MQRSSVVFFCALCAYAGNKHGILVYWGVLYDTVSGCVSGRVAYFFEKGLTYLGMVILSSD